MPFTKRRDLAHIDIRQLSRVARRQIFTMATSNNLDSVSGWQTRSSGPGIAQESPPNIHGDKPFLVKFQTDTYSASNMMLYDRQRSIMGYFMPKADPRLFRDLREEIEGPRGGYDGLKMYRLCKRIGDFELSVCSDRPPSDPVVW